ncbi:GntR family transcriptional regulator [Proteiniclasticum sp. BAD-10]|uniref:GntR family transcriptional regulator n=1 Tax=Proteiniclasticum sediminis TaxID=2804028 RepID=A0A941CTE3_9CLOT|nr:GntR family transcriptional regulator [Proteiniclasticum sediminis]MBR0577056.1 GntR family transcriptional regulator [Proteiniclasticum sediminis]
MEEKKRSKSRNEAQEELEYYIEAQGLKPHDKLPSERELSEYFEMNRSTLRMAIQRMVDEGKLYKGEGSGNYVAEPKIVRNLKTMDSLTKLIEQNGKELRNQVLSATVVESNKQIMQKLKVPLGTKIFQLSRLRFIGDVPFTVETSMMEYARFPGIEKIDFEHESLYQTLEEGFGIHISKGTEKLALTFATEEEAVQLQVQPGDPIFFISGIAEDAEGRPVEYFRSVVRPDKIKFSSILVKETREKEGETYGITGNHL